MKTMYLDMDNTLALFQPYGAELPNYKAPGFFRKLPTIEPKLDETLNKLSEKYTLFILSASPDSNADADKLSWVQQNLPNFPIENVLLCRIGENKAEFLNRLGHKVKNSILVDDYGKNLAQWAFEGGIPVKKRYSLKKGYEHIVNTIKELEQIEL